MLIAEVEQQRNGFSADLGGLDDLGALEGNADRELEFGERALNADREEQHNERRDEYDSFGCEDPDHSHQDENEPDHASSLCAIRRRHFELCVATPTVTPAMDNRPLEQAERPRQECRHLGPGDVV